MSYFWTDNKEIETYLIYIFFEQKSFELNTFVQENTCTLFDIVPDSHINYIIYY